MKIARLETDLFRVPLRRPVALPGSQEPTPVSHLDVLTARVHADGAASGFGFSYGFGGGTVLASILRTVIEPVLVGGDARRTEWLFGRALAELDGRGLGDAGRRAYAAVDLALWDWKGKAAHAPLWQLLGGYRAAVKPISAGVATPAMGVKQSAQACKAALDRGSAGVQVEVGTMDPDLDVERLRQLREDVPDGAWFEVTAAGRYDFSTAAWLGTVGAEELGLDGFADPLPPDDANLRRLIDRLDVGVSVGGLVARPTDFLPILSAGGVDSLRLDPFRLGGVTPARKAIHAAELHRVAVTPVLCAEVGAHLGAASQLGRVCEHVDWFQDLFRGGPTLNAGQMTPGDTPGLGLELNETFAASCRV